MAGTEFTVEMIMESIDYRNLMRNHVGAPVVIATGSPGFRTGLTATAFCSLSDNPPTVLACVNKNASAHPQIWQTKVFSVNLLRDDQKGVAQSFSGQTGLKGEQRFDDQWSAGPMGAPVLQSALASLECDLVDVYDHDTHSVFIGQVRSWSADLAAEPLVYFRGEFGGLRQGETA